MTKITHCPECSGELFALTWDTEDDIAGYECSECGEYYSRQEIIDIANGTYWTWQYWLKLAEKYEYIDFTKAEDRKRFREEFEELSVIWFSKNIERYMDFPKALSEMWCDIHKENHIKESIASIYRRARGYLEYASDRMYINRWLYIRLLLNYDIE